MFSRKVPTNEKLFREFPFLWAITGGYTSNLQVKIDVAYGPLLGFDCQAHYHHAGSVWYAVTRSTDEAHIVQLTRPGDGTNLADLLVTELGLDKRGRILDRDFEISYLVWCRPSETGKICVVLRPAKGHTLLGLAKSRTSKYSFPPVS